MHAVRWAFRDAEQESPRRLLRTRVDPGLVPEVQRFFSGVLFADAQLRLPPEARAAAPPTQSRLWGRGISGDNPIVLLQVREPDAPLLREALAAQSYLRSCGERLDLVLVDAQASGYVTEGAGTLRGVLVKLEVADWIDRPGGIFVVAADQLPEAERRHLEACARVVLDTRDGSLAARLERSVEAPPKLPHFEPALAADAAERPRPSPPAALRQRHRRLHRRRSRVRRLARARPAHSSAVVQRAGQRRVRLPGERVVVGLRPGRSTAARTGSPRGATTRSSTRRPRPSTCATRRRRRSGHRPRCPRARALTRWCGTAPATPPASATATAWCRSSPSSCRPARRSRWPAFASRTRSRATGG